ncbi:tyrosine-type recombinase/integrase [Maritalea mediterranea]|uniref:Tyrosine-type recombinase/integrase n=1 Tax=Maritalea mediterranea TaxID=2909667 RepID=A0ABS9EDS4_9HYPH|nr:site-specific integrase [Maritalea mediterranea]MCF4099915.1 tyrosine-type recombinase/integrase [Maritalea mediterranea]
MAKYKLSAVQVKQAPKGKYGDGNGLWLIKQSKDTGSWMLRISVHGTLRHMGLGSIHDVPLSAARAAAEKWRAIAKDGTDPIQERERQRQKHGLRRHLLADVALDAFEAQKGRLKDGGKAGRWFSPLELHVLPKLGQTPISDIDQIAIRDTLKPLWKAKPATAQKAIQRLGIVLKHGAALGYDVDLQAVAKAIALLGTIKLKTKHIPSMDWREVPVFYASLCDGKVSQLALRLMILTGLRSGSLRYLMPDFIDGDILKVPGIFMKSGVDFDVPLAPAALKVIEDAKRHARGDFLFPGRRGNVISDMTLSQYMKRAGHSARPHGFRSSLRVYLAEHGCPRDVAEMCLSHNVMSKVEASYQRSSLLEIRRRWLIQWSAFVTTGVDDLNNMNPNSEITKSV